jgi:26S proteasome regulatory subunit T6
MFELTIQTYYQNKIEAAELEITKKTQNLRRLEAQRNALNTRGELRVCFTVRAS